MLKEAGFDEHCLRRIKEKGSPSWNPWGNINWTMYEDIKGKYAPDVNCGYALDFIERNANQPFFLYYPMTLTHNPFVLTPANDKIREALGKLADFMATENVIKTR